MTASPKAWHTPQDQPYVGRFAPSPSGPLHFGSLVSALGSWLDARACGGRWLVRMDDLDPPREQPGAADDILRTLEQFNLTWDGSVLYQSTRGQAYQAAMHELITAGAVYPCACTRKQLPESGIYPGTCRNGLPPGSVGRAIRFRVPEGGIAFHDQIRGPQQLDLSRNVGDFVVRRADQITAYQLAVVVDDADQGVTHIVRGADLLDSCHRQIALQQQLVLPTPRYAHLPLVVDAEGAKLSKRLGSDPLDQQDPGTAISQALSILGQPPDADLLGAPPGELLAWAKAHWQLPRVPGKNFSFQA